MAMFSSTNRPVLSRAVRGAVASPYCKAAIALGAIALLCRCLSSAAAAAAVPDFARDVGPLLKRHCFSCHDSTVTKGDVDLAKVTAAASITADADFVQTLLEVIDEGFMPPKDAPHPLADRDRRLIVDWLRHRLDTEARARSGDPGKIVVRRLTNAELNYTLADLTGMSGNWAKDLPRDGSGGEGFSNTGQTLQMSAGQIEKYLDLAQRVAACAIVLPASGPAFANPPVPRGEWGRLAVGRLDAFCVANRLRYVDATPPEQLMAYAYPPGKGTKLDFSKAGLAGYTPYSNKKPGEPLQFLLTSFRLFYRNERLCPSPATFAIPRGTIDESSAAGLSPDAARRWDRMWLDLRHTTGYARPFRLSLLHRWFSFQPYRAGDEPEFEERIGGWQGRRTLVPEKDLSFTVMSLARFIRGIREFTPDELRDYANIQNSADGESGGTMVPNHDAFDGFLSAALDDRQLEAVWRMACDPDSPLAKRLGAVPPPAMQDAWRALDAEERAWRSAVLAECRQALVEFVTRVWRRPLSNEEIASLQADLDRAVAGGQTLEEAVRAGLVRVFVSPNFLYRIERGVPAASGEADAVRPLTDHEIASRLSYFLWASMPDDRLVAAADQGQLADPARRVAEVRRMVRDPRIRRLATEMFGQWLGFYRFDEFDRPDPERFPGFDADLRKAMLGEAEEFCTDLVSQDRDVRLLLTADYAFLPSRRLAEHYGLSDLGDPQADAWATFHPERNGLQSAPRVSLASTPRRGVLGWAAVLTATSHPLRTSPVLRGNWILSDLLGIPTPPPPNAVPELPQDERNTSGLTVGQLLARHRSDDACAACHARIDPLGVALENFDPVGRYRTRDLNGATIENSATLLDGREIAGMPGLVAFLGEEKQQRLFVRRLCRKVLGYALGRKVLPGDGELLAGIERDLAAGDGRFSAVVEAIVTSRQFGFLRLETASAEEKQP